MLRHGRLAQVSTNQRVSGVGGGQSWAWYKATGLSVSMHLNRIFNYNTYEQTLLSKFSSILNKHKDIFGTLLIFYYNFHYKKGKNNMQPHSNLKHL